ncbi:MAG: hypothetical protein AAB385_03980, partial [Planctomycetota bacterium]
MSRVATLCGVFGILFVCLGAQCFGPQPPPVVSCTADADCDDDDLCTTDTCTIAAGETDGECDSAFACSDEDHCTDAGCVECLDVSECDNSDACDGDETCGANGACDAGTPLDCDDGDFCNGTETCIAATGCVDGTAPCDAVTETCNEDTNACVAVCDDAGDCDDALACTVDACVNLGCENTAVDCNDDVACTDDSCDAATGDCVNADNCTAPETCNLTSGLCEP